MSNSSLQSINTESMFALRFNIYIQSRLRRALRVDFQHLTSQLANLHLTSITIDIDDAATIIDNYRSDIAFFRIDSALNFSSNRCSDDLKVSWKWESEYRISSMSEDRREFLQVLSQINYYMRQHRARYAFVLSDTELISIKRLDENDNLLIAQIISWEAKRSERLTILLRLWYLEMLDATNNDWRLS